MLLSPPQSFVAIHLRCVLAWGALACVAVAQPPSPSTEGSAAQRVHVNAHAHNDYLHTRPLLDALDQGFGSIEADIFLVEGRLLVAHSILELRKERTLEDLYLKPLATRCDANQGRVYPEGPELQLLIDFKSDANPTYQALNELLVRYAKLLTRLEQGEVKPGAIRVIVSGNRPIETMSSQQTRLMFLDGRMNDLIEKPPVELVPLVSDQWSKHFKWQGNGEMPAEEQKKLNDIVRQTHEQQRLLRFWGAPDNQNTWKQLLAARVDLINTDKLAELAEFLNSQR
jgi:hypothetical protein